MQPLQRHALRFLAAMALCSSGSLFGVPVHAEQAVALSGILGSKALLVIDG